MSRIETLRQAVIDAELRLEATRKCFEVSRDDYKLAFDDWMTAQRELAEATRGTEVAL